MSKPRDSLYEVSGDGHFVRKASTYREVISVEHPIFTPEAGRYHLYISLACPWANGAYLVRKMKGLEDIISVSIVHPTWQRTRPDNLDDIHAGWVFRDPSDEPMVPVSGYGSVPCDGTVPDSVNNARCIRDLYDLVQDTGGKYTVPVLWDKKNGTIVNNESLEIMKMFNSAFDHLLPEGSAGRELDLYPMDLHGAFDEQNDWIYNHINNGVYRCGFAKSQAAYSESFNNLCNALDRVEEILIRQRYILSDKLTLLDIRLFMTLIRFDEVYVVYFKTNKKFLAQYPNINNFMREIYQTTGVASCVNMDHIKRHYFTSHPTLNAYSIIPEGPGVIHDMQQSHDRASKH